jgi:hypothetical protein
MFKDNRNAVKSAGKRREGRAEYDVETKLENAVDVRIDQGLHNRCNPCSFAMLFLVGEFEIPSRYDHLEREIARPRELRYVG